MSPPEREPARRPRLRPPRSTAEALAQSQRAREVGDLVRGESTATLALQLAQAAGDRGAAACAGVLLAYHRMRLGHAEEAVQAGLAALPLVDGLGLAADSVDLRCTLVMAYRELAMPAEGLSHAMAALQLARADGRAVLMSWALNRLGTLHDAMGNIDRAIELMEQALALALESGDTEARLSATLNLGTALAERANTCRIAGDVEGERSQATRARAQICAAARLAQAKPHAMMFCQAVEFLASLSLGDLDATQEALERHDAFARAVGTQHFVQATRLMHGQLLLARGEAAAACEVLASIDRSDLAPESTPRLLEAEYRALKACGRHEAALAAAEALLAWERQVMRRRAEAQSRVLLRELEIQLARDETQRLRTRATALQARAEAATRESLEDALTGLANRRALDNRLALLLQASRAGAPPLAAVLVDVDYFKRINDSHGHATGDAVLRALGALMRVHAPQAACIARNGGEEFVLLLAGAGAQAAAGLCESLREAVAAHGWPAPLRPGAVTLSIGWALAEPTDDGPALLRRADAAMYRAKAGGRNRVEAA